MALVPEYQRAMVAAIAELRRYPQFAKEVALAKELGLSPSALNRITEDSGGSMRVLQRLAELLGKKTAEELVKEYEGAEVRLRDLPNFATALEAAKATADHPEDVWIEAGNRFAVRGQTECSPMSLIKAAEFIVVSRPPQERIQPRAKKRPR